MRGSNDDVDNQLLAAVAAPAVDYLVTEDQGLMRKAAKVGLQDRVLSLSEAVEMLEALFDKPTAPPPAVESKTAYRLNQSDPIWDSFRVDYPQFDEWLQKCKREHRQSWVISGAGRYAGVTIVNAEKQPPAPLKGKVLKICSFKVDPDHSGYRFGELLLKTIFRYALENSYAWLFVHVFEKHGALVALFEEFGFQSIGRSESDELVLAKPMNPSASNEKLAGLPFHVRFGPSHVDWSSDAFIVPIRPIYHGLLFPDRQEQDQPTLFEGEHPFGNSIRKAYLSRSTIKRLSPGSILLFYRSEDMQGLTEMGVVENVLRSSDASEIASFVARRTVYSFKEIEQMAAEAGILAIRFRDATLIKPAIRLQELIGAGVLKDAPQSITQLSPAAKKWTMTRISQ